ncbi:KilA-N domain-containing protein [Microcoleus sp. B3-D7]|uniref:KilA-N domain-containing protein n=1 Tax=Microcoleus sp. B3-D7 TaxID=2818659 RepID=UPI002FD4CF4D
MSKLMISWFDQFPEYNGQEIEIRGKDGYVSVRDINKAINKRFNNWTRTKFAKEVLEELSALTGLPVANSDTELAVQSGYSKVSSRSKALIDYVRGDESSVFVHPSVAFAYSMSDAKFFARISLWLSQMQEMGTVNPHVKNWTQEEFQRGLKFNRDDINEMYSR